MAAPPQSDRLYLVDGTSQLYRAYYALGLLTNDEGLPTHAIYGFTTMLRKLLREEQPHRVAVVFDPPGPVFRHDEFADYKANRAPTPDDLKVQVPYAKQVCEAMGIRVVEQKGFEADDVIATATRQAREAAMEVVVVASDKDLLQLVGDGVTVFDPAKNLRLDPPAVTENFGVPPERVLDVLGLMGDSVDNIPGVPGVGQKTAVSAVATYGTVESIVERATRFAAAWEARDAWLETLQATADGELTAERVAGLVEGTEHLTGAIAALIEVERDTEMAARLEAVATLLAETDVASLTDQVGQPGKKSVRPLAALKRELKALDRGSSKRAWFSIRDNAEQAALSKRLATLEEKVPLEFAPDLYLPGEIDQPKIRALFETLGFRSLLEELEAGAEPAAATEAIDVRCVRTEDALAEVVEACSEAERVSLIVISEPGSPLTAAPVGVGLAWAADAAAYVPLAHQGLSDAERLTPEGLARGLGPWLGDATPSLVGWNVKDQSHLLQRLGIEPPAWQLDTLVAGFMLHPGRSSYGLPRLVGEFLGRTLPELTELTGSGAKRRPVSELDGDETTQFVGVRAASLWALGPVLEERLREAELDGLYRDLDGPLLPILGRMESAGIEVDAGFLESMSSEMEQELTRLTKRIHELAGEEFNVDSPKQLREVLFDRMGIKPRRKTAKSGAASTDAQTLEELAPDHPIAGELLEYRELSKLKGTYVDALPRLIHPDTGRVHTHYDPTGAATGRLSSSDPNLQNIPVRSPAGRRIREAFVAASGHAFVAADYSQIELRVLAHLTGDPGLISAFRAGEDIHRHTASRVFDVLPDLVSDTMRRRAKAVNFGLLYGMSETRLAREQGMKRSEAKRFVEAYFNRFGRVGEYIERIREEARRNGAVHTLFGRVRYFPQLHERVHRGIQEQALRGAVNTTVQGTAADLMKMAMLKVDALIRERDLPARMLLQVHDELLLEVREDQVEAVAEQVVEAMEQVYELEVPLVVDRKTGHNWSEVT